MENPFLIQYMQRQMANRPPQQLVKGGKPTSTGVSDDVPAVLSEGEYVINAEQVSKLGGGATDPGARFFEDFLEIIDEMDRDTAVTFADMILVAGNMLLEEQPSIGDDIDD